MVLISSNQKMRVTTSGMMCHTQFWGDSTTEIQPRINTDGHGLGKAVSDLRQRRRIPDGSTRIDANPKSIRDNPRNSRHVFFVFTLVYPCPSVVKMNRPGGSGPHPDNGFENLQSGALWRTGCLCSRSVQDVGKPGPRGHPRQRCHPKWSRNIGHRACSGTRSLTKAGG
jgi:hypothetical protein